MKAEIEKAIQKLIEKALEKDVKSHEALQFTQSALNLAHAAATMKNT